MKQVLTAIIDGENAIISTHPHRWTRTAFEYILKDCFFIAVKRTAKILLRIPGMERIMGKFYFLAKKI